MKISVFGKDIEVIFKDLSDDGIYGKFESKESRIYIHQGLTNDDIEATLLHEIFHAICYRIGIRQALPHELEEILVESFATWLVENYEFKDLRVSKTK